MCASVESVRHRLMSTDANHICAVAVYFKIVKVVQSLLKGDVIEVKSEIMRVMKGHKDNRRRTMGWSRMGEEVVPLHEVA